QMIRKIMERASIVFQAKGDATRENHQVTGTWGGFRVRIKLAEFPDTCYKLFSFLSVLLRPKIHCCVLPRGNPIPAGLKSSDHHWSNSILSSLHVLHSSLL
ncbi:MAG: hypothetical protein KKA76_00915, partial [Proteobacteria bacterium]|nr:hypothetical protein [Pseudomonadota bacterium]